MPKNERIDKLLDAAELGILRELSELVDGMDKEVFPGPKGDKGEKGDRGPQGLQGRRGKRGKDGADGKDGKDGKTPVKGKDYFTSEEIKKITTDAAISAESQLAPFLIDHEKAVESMILSHNIAVSGLVDDVTFKIEEIDVHVDNLVTERLDTFEKTLKVDILDTLPKSPPPHGGGSGATFLASARDFDIGRAKDRTDSYVITWNASKKKFDLQEGGGGGGHVIQGEGTPFTQRTNLNFVGAGVTVTDDAGNDATVITIPETSTPNLQQVTDEGNTTTNNITIDNGGLSNNVLNLNGSTHSAVRSTATDRLELVHGGSVRLRVDGLGKLDASLATALEIPNDAAPTLSADGEIAVDTSVTDFDAGVLKYYSGEEMAAIAVPVAQLASPMENGRVAYNATDNEFQLIPSGVSAREVVVDQGGNGDYTTIAAALAFVATQTRSSTERWLVTLNPGEYNESGLSVPTWTIVSGRGHVNIPNASGCVIDINTSSFRSGGTGVSLVEGSVLANLTVRYLNTGASMSGSPTMIDMSDTGATGGSNEFAELSNATLFAVGSMNGVTFTGIKGDGINGGAGGAVNSFLVVLDVSFFGGGSPTQMRLVDLSNAYAFACYNTVIQANYDLFAWDTTYTASQSNQVVNTVVTTPPFGPTGVDFAANSANVTFANSVYTSSSVGTGSISHLDRGVPNNTYGTFQSANTTTTTRTFKAIASQTSNLTEWQDTSSNVLASVDTSGNVTGQNVNVTDFLNLGSATELTIASGAVTATRSYHTIDTESDAATDDLDTINGGTDGDVLIISANNSSRTVVAKDGTGNLSLSGDFSMDHADDRLTLLYNGTNWVELFRSNNA